MRAQSVTAVLTVLQCTRQSFLLLISCELSAVSSSASQVPVPQTINTFMITARTCTRALVAHDRQQHPGIWSWLKGQATWASIEWRILLLQLAAAYQGWTARG